MDWKIQVIPLPVTDVDRAKEFYTERVGFNLDVDHSAGDSFRVVQFTPPGSSCSIIVGVGITDAVPGSVRGLHIVVSDIEAAHAELVGRGVDVTAVRHMTANGWVDGVDADHADFNSFADFADFDGNTFVLQECGHNRDA